MRHTDDALPRLGPGLTLLHDGTDGAGLHRLAAAELRRADGPVYWLDARNRRRRGRCSTAPPASAPTRRPRPTLVVAPNLRSLYRDDDVPDRQAARLLDAAASLFAELAAAADVPVLVTEGDGRANAVGGTDEGRGPTADPPDQVAARADRQFGCRRTDAGLAYEGEGFRTAVYWQDGCWQTTIPYWVDLLGSVPRMPASGWRPGRTRNRGRGGALAPRLGPATHRPVPAATRGRGAERVRVSTRRRSRGTPRLSVVKRPVSGGYTMTPRRRDCHARALDPSNRPLSGRTSARGPSLR